MCCDSWGRKESDTTERLKFRKAAPLERFTRHMEMLKALKFCSKESCLSQLVLNLLNHETPN